MPTTYGDFPGIRTVTTGGGIAGTVVGREQIAVLFGRGDPSDGAASYNTPTQVDTRIGGSTQFGAGTELADGVSGALGNGANIDYLYGVMPEETAESNVTISGNGQLQNNPIVEDQEVTNLSASGKDVSFVYESPPPSPDSGVNIKAQTGEYNCEDDTTDFTLSYAWLDWDAALDAADDTVPIGSSGVYSPLTTAASVAQSLSSKLDEEVEGNLRQDYRLIKGVMGGEPNATGPEGEAQYDTGSYSPGVSNDAMFLAAPVQRAGSPFTIIGGLAGMFAGHALTNPVYGDGVGGYGRLDQTLTHTEVDALRSAYTIPIQDQDGTVDSGIGVKDNLSTSTATDWERDFHRRRIVDQVIITLRQVGQATLNERLVNQSLEVARQNIINELQEFAELGLIRDNPDQTDQGGQTGSTSQQEQRYFVEVTRVDNPDEIKVALGFTPVGIAKRVDNEVTIS